MVRIICGEVDAKDPDGMIDIMERTSNLIFNLSLLDLNSGIIVYHDGRLANDELEKFLGKSFYCKEIRINMTGWFHIHYKLIIEVKEDYTFIDILYK